MQSKSAALQEEINSLDLAIQQGASDAQLNLWEMQRDELRKQYATALEEEQQAQVAEEGAGFVFDTIEVDGLTMPEIITDDSKYKLARKGVQNLVVTINTSHANIINDLKEEHRQETEGLRECISAESLRADQMQDDNKDLEVANYQLGLEKDELSEKVTKIAKLQYDADQQIEQQKQHIADLQNQIAIGARGALNVINIPQDTSALAAEIIASKPRITNVKFKDPNGIDTRTKTAEQVLTGQRFEYEAIYEKRYIILNAEQAEQYRADEANKKAEAEQQQAAIPVLEVPEIQPVNAVSEVEAPAQENSFQEVEATDNAGLQNDQGNSIMESVVSEESQVITLESLSNGLRSLRSEVLGNGRIQQYVENDMDKFKGWAAKVEQILINMGQWKNDEVKEVA